MHAGAGGFYVSTKAASHPTAMNANRGGRPYSYDLTDKERQVCELLARGLTQADIGRQLGVTRAAVSSTVQRALERIGAERTFELVRYIREQARAG
jgi:DNA-binding CsgD family transcriptional regulator